MSERIRSESRTSAGLAGRRRRTRRRLAIVCAVLVGVGVAALFYLLWQPAFRITEVDVFGTELPIDPIALEAMEGSYAWLVPRNSTFFVPEERIRSQILSVYPTIAAVSIFRKGFTGLTIKTTDRAGIARWCGLTHTPTVEEYCYLFDASGIIFAPAASTTEAIHSFALYAPLENEALEPLQSKLASAAKLPPTFDFARALVSFGVKTERITIQGDEVVLHLSNGVQVRYVLGQEQAGYAALVSAKENLNLADGSLDYVDLRFEGRVYLKRRVDSAPLEVESQ